MNHSIITSIDVTEQPLKKNKIDILLQSTNDNLSQTDLLQLPQFQQLKWLDIALKIKTNHIDDDIKKTIKNMKLYEMAQLHQTIAYIGGDSTIVIDEIEWCIGIDEHIQELCMYDGCIIHEDGEEHYYPTVKSDFEKKLKATPYDKYVYSSRYDIKPDNSKIHDCAVSGNLRLLIWMCEQFAFNKPTLGAINNASLNGHLHIVQYLFETCKVQPTAGTIEYASKNGHLHIVQYLFETCKVQPTSYAISSASYHGHLQLFQYQVEICKVQPTSDEIANASCCGHIHVIQYLVETCQVQPTSDALENASDSGHIHVVQYLVETCKLQPNSAALANASYSGHLHIVQYLVETCQVQPTQCAIKYALLNGHIDILQYLTDILQV